MTSQQQRNHKWQILLQNYEGKTEVHSVHDTKAAARATLETDEESMQFIEVWIEHGTLYRHRFCKKCKSFSCSFRYDQQGFRLGFLCDLCYIKLTN